MLNKTDSASSSDAPRQEASLISSSNKTNNAVQLSSTQMTVGNTSVSSNGLMARFKRLSLSTKTTILAIAMVTVPVFAIGLGGYIAASNSLRNKVFDLQQTEAKGFADKVNRFMLERYGDIQVLSNLPIITNGASSSQQKAVLDNYVNTYKVYEGIGVFNLNGDAIVQSEGTNFDNQGNLKYFQDAKSSGNAVIGKPVFLSLLIATVFILRLR